MDTRLKMVPAMLAAAIAGIGWPQAALAQSCTHPDCIPQPWTYEGSMELQRREREAAEQQQSEASYQAPYEAPTYSAPSYGESSQAPANSPPPAPAAPISRDPATAAYQRGDYATAARLLRADALQGDANAQKNLGYLYEEGLGVPRDPAQALAWYQRAADQGYAAAYNDLGAMYANGTGVPQDLVRAYVLFTQAWAKGDGDVVRLAISNRERVRSQMSYAQQSEALRQEQALRGQ